MVAPNNRYSRASQQATSRFDLNVRDALVNPRSAIGKYQTESRHIKVVFFGNAAYRAEVDAVCRTNLRPLIFKLKPRNSARVADRKSGRL